MYLFFYFSDNPKEFLQEQLEKLQTSKATKTNYPCLFDESNIQSVFGMLDPTGRGFITTQQYREGLYDILSQVLFLFVLSDIKVGIILGFGSLAVPL